jgi:dynein heavy chain
MIQVNKPLNLAGQKKSSLGVFLLQECEKFNTLLSVIKSSIRDLQLAVSGKIVMSAIMEKVYNSFLDNQVPKV